MYKIYMYSIFYTYASLKNSLSYGELITLNEPTFKPTYKYQQYSYVIPNEPYTTEPTEEPTEFPIITTMPSPIPPPVSTQLINYSIVCQNKDIDEIKKIVIATCLTSSLGTTLVILLLIYKFFVIKKRIRLNNYDYEFGINWR